MATTFGLCDFWFSISWPKLPKIIIISSSVENELMEKKVRKALRAVF
jgi:hypothetical protein